MKRMCIGLAIALVVIIVLCICLHSFLKDYLIDTGSFLPKLDLERFLYDMANKYIDSLYNTVCIPALTP